MSKDKKEDSTVTNKNGGLNNDGKEPEFVGGFNNSIAVEDAKPVAEDEKKTRFCRTIGEVMENVS